MLGCCLALLLRAAAAVPGGRPGRDVGICYTRNMVHLESHVLHVDALRKVVLSASSLRRADGGLATCLFTEMDAATVHATTRELVGAKLFDVPVPNPGRPSARAPAHARRRRLVTDLKKFKSPTSPPASKYPRIGSATSPLPPRRASHVLGKKTGRKRRAQT